MVELKEKLLLNYLDTSNTAMCSGEFDMPALRCNIDVYPDFLALDSEPGKYFKTNLTGVCFFRYDDRINGWDGLFNAIYYNNEERLQYFKDRFAGVRFIVEMDPSQCGDVHRIENLYRLFQKRIVSVWFAVNWGIVVIPLISYANEESFRDMLLGIEEGCSVVAFGIKGNMNNPREVKLLEKAVKYTVDHIQLKTIIVYSVCGDDNSVLEAFSYATEKNIQVVIPQNTLREQNQKRWRDKHGKI